MSIGNVIKDMSKGAADSIAMSKATQELKDQVKGQEGKAKFHNNGVKNAVDAIT